MNDRLDGGLIFRNEDPSPQEFKSPMIPGFDAPRRSGDTEAGIFSQTKNDGIQNVSIFQEE